MTVRQTSPARRGTHGACPCNRSRGSPLWCPTRHAGGARALWAQSPARPRLRSWDRLGVVPYERYLCVTEPATALRQSRARAPKDPGGAAPEPHFLLGTTRALACRSRKPCARALDENNDAALRTRWVNGQPTQHASSGESSAARCRARRACTASQEHCCQRDSKLSRSRHVLVHGGGLHRCRTRSVHHWLPARGAACRISCCSAAGATATASSSHIHGTGRRSARR